MIFIIKLFVLKTYDSVYAVRYPKSCHLSDIPQGKEKVKRQRCSEWSHSLRSEGGDPCNLSSGQDTGTGGKQPPRKRYTRQDATATGGPWARPWGLRRSQALGARERLAVAAWTLKTHKNDSSLRSTAFQWANLSGP